MEIRNEELRMRNWEQGIGNKELGMRNWEQGIRNEEDIEIQKSAE